jgi:HTH-type transcriptional regulator, glycine betaine synthesis regulator
MFCLYNKSKSLSITHFLSKWGSAVIDLLLNAAQPFGLPKPLGQIYGLLFCRDESLSMVEIMVLRQISKGSASPGFCTLNQFAAVNLVFERSDRKERFLAEMRLCKLVSGFIPELGEPHLDKGFSRLQNLGILLSSEEDLDSAHRRKYGEKILVGWHRQMSRLLLVVKMIIGKSDRLPAKNKD